METLSLHLTHGTLALSIKAITVFLLTITIFHQDLAMVTNEALQSEFTSYVLAIPLLFTYLLYRKRKMLRAVVPLEANSLFENSTSLNEIIGALLCLTAFLLYWRGSYTLYALEYHIVSLPIFVSGLILIIFNAKTLRVLAFPVAFLLLLTPPPSRIAYIAGTSIATLSSEISYSILKAAGLPVSITTEYGAPTLVATNPSGSSIIFVIGEASSGVYSLIGFTIFAAFLIYIARGPAWKRVTLFFASMPLIYVLNIIRIIILISIGCWQGLNITLDFSHIFGGWVLIILGSAIMITLSEKILKTPIFIPRHSARALTCPNCNPTPRKDELFCQVCGKLFEYAPISISRRDFSKIVALIVLICLITTISVPIFALTKGPPEVLVQAPGNEQATTAQVFPEISGYDLQFVYRDTEFEQTAPRDRALVYAYVPTSNSSETIWITLEIGSSSQVWHSWEASIITWQQKLGRTPKATQLDLREVQLLQNPPILGEFFAFQSTESNITQVVLYWYETAEFSTGSNSSSKYVKISLMAYPENSKQIPQTEDLLLRFGKSIIAYWQPIKTWSVIALTIAQNGSLLLATTTTSLIIVVVLEALRRQRERRSKLNIYQKLKEEDKLVLKAAQQAKHEEKSTAQTIAKIYEKLAGKPIETEMILRNLKQAEEAGLVEKEITSQEDEPLIIWKDRIPRKDI